MSTAFHRSTGVGGGSVAVSLLLFTTLTPLVRAQSVYPTPFRVSTLLSNGAPVGIFYPQGVAVATNGTLYVTATDASTILELSLVGTNWVTTTLAGQSGISGTNDGTGTTAQFNLPIGLAVDSTGNIFVADTQNATIRKVSPVGTNWVVTTIAGRAGTRGQVDGTNGSALFEVPYSVAVDSGGNVYVADPGTSAMRKVSPVGTNWVTTTLTGSSDGLYQPAGVAVDRLNNLFVSDQANNTLSKVSPVGTNWVVTTLAGQAGNLFGGSADGTGTNAQFSMPLGVAVDSADNVYVADSQNNLLRKVSPVAGNWVVTTLAGRAGVPGGADGTGSNALFNVPSGVAVDPAGNVYVADSQNNRLREGANSLASYSVGLLTGYNLVANQLNLGSNTLAEIMPVVPDGSVLYKYDNASGTWAAAIYSAAQGGWAPDNLTLKPGEGAFLQSPTNFTLTFSGTPNTPILPVLVPVGATYLLSRQTNGVGNYENTAGIYPPEETVIYSWDAVSQEYVEEEFVFGDWDPDLVEPTFAVGEAVWISTAGDPPPAIAVPPLIASPPANLTVQPGDSATFTATVGGPGPFSYQWLSNGIPISGATNASYSIANVQTPDQATYSVMVSNPSGTTTSVGGTLTSSEFQVQSAPASSNCCWTFDLSQLGGAAGDITSVTATLLVTGGAFATASGPAGASSPSVTPTAVTWSIPSPGGLYQNAAVVTACFTVLPNAGAVLKFEANPLGQDITIAIGGNGSCGSVVQVYTNVPLNTPCCDMKNWNFKGPFDDHDYSFRDPDQAPCDLSLKPTLPYWPLPRYGQAMVFHDQTNTTLAPCLLMFGGSDSNGVPNNETWQWTTRWQPVGCNPTIPARSFHAMAFDPGRQRTTLFGGLGSSGWLNDTWEWNLASSPSAWTPYTPANPPSPRQGHAMAFDRNSGKTILFGGLDASGFLNDTWTWDGTFWTQYNLPGPSPRQGHAMVYDPNFGGLVLVGGTGTNGVLGDMWNLTYNTGSGYAWQLVQSSGAPQRTGHAMAYDSDCGRIVVFGGFDTNGNPLGDTWEYDDSTHAWSQPSPGYLGVPPGPRGAMASAYRPSDLTFFIYGGDASPSSTTNLTPMVSPGPANDLWAFYYNPNRVNDGPCLTDSPCPNVVTGPLWQRTLTTEKFSWHHPGTTIQKANHAFTYHAFVELDQFNTTGFGGYPQDDLSIYQYPQDRARNYPRCNDNILNPGVGCPNYSLPSSAACGWSFHEYPLYSDYALFGSFCPNLNLNLSFYAYYEIRRTRHVGTLYADGATSPFPESPFPGPCGSPQPYTLYWEYSDAGVSATPGSGFPTSGPKLYKLSNTLGENEKVDLKWTFSEAGVGTAIGEVNPCVTETSGDPCQLAYFEFDQVSGTDLRLRARVQGGDLEDYSTLFNAGGVRQFQFYINADNSTNTGDQCCFDLGADYYVQLQQNAGFDQNGNPAVVTTPSIYQWNSCVTNHFSCGLGGWVQMENQVSNVKTGRTEVAATVPMNAVGNPLGCYSVWVVCNTPFTCGLSSLPVSPCTCRLQMQRVPDTNCPVLVLADTTQVSGSGGKLTAPIVLTFNKAMSAVTPAEISMSPPQAFTSYLVGPGDNTVDLRPASGAWTPGCYTVTLLPGIKDASGNSMCTNYTFDFCVPDSNFYVTDQTGNPADTFNQGDNIYVEGCGFPPNSTVNLYLVQAENTAHPGSLLADWTTTGPKQVTVGANGCLPAPTLIGMATEAMSYKVVADLNNNGAYDTNVDRVTDLCGLGLAYGLQCTNLVDNDVVAWWPFCEASAGGPVNELINANHGLVAGAYTTLIPGVVGQARTFNLNLPPAQAPTYVLVPDALDFDGLLHFGNDDLSIELWVNTTQTGEAPLVDKRQFSGFSGGNFSGYYFYLLNGTPTLQLGDGNSVWTFTSSAPSAASGNWAHVAVAVDQTALAVTLYVDGAAYPATSSSPAYTAPINTDNPANNNADLWMAASHANPGAAPYYVGALDELTLYDAALTGPQMQYIYVQGANGKCYTPPSMTNQPVRATGSLGAFATIATPPWVSPLPVSYQWYLNGTPLVDSQFIIGSQSNVLMILATNITQSGTLYVRIADASGYTYSPLVPFTVLAVTPSSTVVEFNSSWRYLANGAAPAANWSQPGFDDTQWASGSGLFGAAPPGIWPYPFQTSINPPALGGPITTYYRTAFLWDGATNDVNLVSTNFIEDGAVFYINGVEAGRLRVPPNQNYLTLASPQPNPGQPETITFPVGSLLPGTNLLAVEVHQSSASAAQDVFGLGLSANVSLGAIPTLTISNAGRNTVVSWSGPGTLQSTPYLVAPWSNLPAASPYTVLSTNGNRFYRLRVP